MFEAIVQCSRHFEEATGVAVHAAVCLVCVYVFMCVHSCVLCLYIYYHTAVCPQVIECGNGPIDVVLYTTSSMN